MKRMRPFFRLIALMALFINCFSAYAYYDQASGLYFDITDDSGKTVKVSYGRGGAVNIPSTITIPNEYWYGPSGDHGTDDDLWRDYGTTYTVTEVGDDAFYGFSNLYSVSIPPTVKHIGNYAFYGCRALRYVIIPESVTQIGYNAFNGCDNLISVTSQSYNPPYMYNEWCFSEKTYNNASLFVPYFSTSFYMEANWWKNFFMYEEMATAYHEGFLDSYLFGRIRPIGVTADGASKMFIYFDRNNIKGIDSWEIKTTIDEEQVQDTTITGSFGEFKKLENGKYGFDYCAPEDFPEKYNEKNTYEVRLEVKAIDIDGDSVKGKADITIMRTGVLLVHGIWSDDGCFSKLANYLQNDAGYLQCQILNCNYKETHANSFEDNTYTNAVVNGHLEQLFRQLAKTGIISSKYDLVGHSMGGILSRMYAQEKNARAVNRIITLDTPHSGSQLAYLRNGVLSGLAAISSSNLALMAAVRQIYNEFTTGRQAAVENLMPSSSSIKRLNDPILMSNAEEIPVHAINSCIKELYQEETDTCFYPIPCEAIGGIAFHDVILGRETTIRGVEPLYSIYQALFNGDNDGVVSCVSQAGGLSGSCLTTQYDSYQGIGGTKSWAYHTNTNNWLLTFQNISNLLKACKSSSQFSSDGFHPVDISKQSTSFKVPEGYELKDAPETSFIQIKLEKVNTMRAIDINVSTSPDIECFITYTFVGNNKIIFSNDKSKSRFIVPDLLDGQLKVYALGRTVNNELVVNSDSAKFMSVGPCYSIFFEDQSDKTMSVGQSLTFNVMTNWDNGYDYITPVFSVNKSGVLDVQDQIVTAIHSGECKLIASYNGLSDSINITVVSQSHIVPGDVNDDGEVGIADINMVIDALLTGGGGSAYDINGDGEVSIADVTALIDLYLSTH